VVLVEVVLAVVAVGLAVTLVAGAGVVVVPLMIGFAVGAGCLIPDCAVLTEGAGVALLVDGVGAALLVDVTGVAVLTTVVVF